MKKPVTIPAAYALRETANSGLKSAIMVAPKNQANAASRLDAPLILVRVRRERHRGLTRARRIVRL
jgi:hypothetical protein